MPMKTRSQTNSLKKSKTIKAASRRRLPRDDRQNKSKKKTSSLASLPASHANEYERPRTRARAKREQETVTPSTPKKPRTRQRNVSPISSSRSDESDHKESESSPSSSSSRSLTPKKRRLQQRGSEDLTPPSKKNKKNQSKSTDSPSKALAQQFNRLELEGDVHMSDPELELGVDMKPQNREQYLEKLRDRLLTSAVDFELKCREREAGEVFSYLESHLKSKTPGSLYICGSPGTGKSATVNKLLAVLQEEKRKYGIKSMVTMNAMSLHRPSLIFSYLWELIANETVGLEAAVSNLEELFLESSGKKMFVVVLDEIDGLLGRQQAVLYRLFEWCHTSINPDSKLILIGIANSIDLTDRFLPKLKHHCCEPELIIFEPYSSEQLFQIVQSRLRGCFQSKVMDVDDDQEEEKDSQNVPLFDTKALQYCAGRVAKRSGDIRKCLELCRTAIDEILLNDLTKERIEFRDMASVLRTVFSSRHVEAMQSLPSQQCNVVVIASILVRYRDRYRKLQAEREAKRIERESENAEMARNRLKKLKTKVQTPTITIAQLDKFYKYMAQRFNLARVSLSEFHIIIDSLVSLGLLNRSSTTTSRRKHRGNSFDQKTQVNVVVSFDDVLCAMEEHSLWAKFFEDIDAANEESNFYIPENCRG